MKLSIHKTNLTEILPLRSKYLEAMNCQVRYDACHARGWSDSYLVRLDGKATAYAAIKGFDALKDRDTIFEFYVLPAYQQYQRQFFEALLQSTEADFVECQTNDPFLSPMVFEYAKQIESKVMLFEAGGETDWQVDDFSFREREPGDILIGLNEKDPGKYILARAKEAVAMGGFLTHYNEPFADIYMEVREDLRQQGLATFLVQELKKACIAAGRIPAARCNIANEASRRTLVKAGMKICGYMLSGKL